MGAEPSTDPGGRSRWQSLEFNSTALMAAGLINSALGLVFWALAARFFVEAEVGRAGAVINTAVMLSTLANLSLGALYERFLPLAGRLTGGLLIRGYVVTGTLALTLGAIFIAVGPADDLFGSTTGKGLFPLCVAVLAAFALADSVLVGLRIARWAAVKNITLAVLKLTVLCGLGITVADRNDSMSGGSMPGSTAIEVSWVLTAAVAVIAVQAVVVMSVRAQSRTEPSLPPNRQLLSYFASTFGIAALASITPLVLPLLVVVQAGATDTAYFTVSWTIVSAILVAVLMVCGPFIADAAAHPEQLAALLRRFLRLFGAASVLAACALGVGGPVALWLVSPDYAANAWSLMLAAALVPIASAPGVVFACLCRVHRTMAPAVALQVVSTVGVITGCLWVIPRHGITGIGWTYAAVETLGSLLIAVPLWRRLRTDLRAVPAQPNPRH